ncbi:3-hydroxyacyl-CoA dehydrogenase NAD-binding domain-containing protein [Phytomonospora sp. NPDC050363]|uniref:3-hydroxyacyl-CoA dehydrogenase n=1 Tax=Phytomonospora sp. NPDC050363 TaxID=3155642 RepID=UPI0033D0AA10
MRENSKRRVGVVGLGTMGAGIVEVFARGEFQVVGVEVDEAARERGAEHLRKSTDKAVSRGKLSTEDAAALHERITLTTDFAALSEVDLVVEAVPERIDIKHDLFRRLDEICEPRTILATNTSSLPVTQIAETTGRPLQVVGMHFFNPAPVMKLIEVVHTPVTSSQTVDLVRELALGLGKTPVVCGDKPGFIVNRLLFGYLNQAVAMVDDGEATGPEIDAAMRSAGFPMGPIMLLDVIGLDTSVQILDTIYTRDGQLERYAAAKSLRSLAAEGHLGRKTGRGFYEHGSPVVPAELDEDRAARIAATLLAPHRADARQMIDSGYATAEDIDTAMTLGCGYPKGILTA